MRLEFKLKKKGKNRWKLKVLIGLLVVGGLTGVYLSPVGQTSIQFAQRAWGLFSERAHWQLEQVIVEGHKRTDRKTIMNVLNINQGQNMASISLNQVRQQLLTLPWIKDVIVERHLPGTLIIQITEKIPIALWQNNQAYLPLDETGATIKDNKLLPADLILVVGSDAPEQTLSLLGALEKVPSINSLVRSAVRVEKRRWNLRLSDAETGLEIMLPEVNFDKALERLAEKDKKENLLRKNLQAIDLRLSYRIILHPKKEMKKKEKKK